ncbi:MAG: hypothetical protein OEZ22_04015 [Spirochaetia bacterium]|nr:hypothetical protein [Spirochaetia bacterium]
MRYTVYWKKYLEKKIQKLPRKEKEMFAQLVIDLQDKGPFKKTGRILVELVRMNIIAIYLIAGLLVGALRIRV